MKRVVAVIALVAGALVLTLAIPFGPWRTGRMELQPLSLLPGPPAERPVRRLWIDTDAACGHGARIDPDDCLALLALFDRARGRIAGVSAVAGNAPLEVTERTTRALVAQLSGGAMPVRGAAALRAALEAEPLAIVALGPLTNIAAALRDRPDLAGRVERLVAVMGRRPGHLFHPAEGASGAMLFGHGPVFSDFNFEQDKAAAAEVLALDVPITFIPYDAARHIEITAADLDRLSSRGGAAAWVAARSRAWLQFWRDDIARGGFYPFDLLAGAYVIKPDAFRCALVEASIGRDPLFLVPWREKALLVTQPPDRRPVLYCDQLRQQTKLDTILLP